MVTSIQPCLYHKSYTRKVHREPLHLDPGFLSLSKQIIPPVNPVANRKCDRRLCSNAVHRRLHLLFPRASQLHRPPLSLLHTLASIHGDIV